MKYLALSYLVSLVVLSSCLDVQAKPQQPRLKAATNINEFDLTGPKGIKIHVYQNKPKNPKREIIWIHGMPGIPQGSTFVPAFFFEEHALEDTLITCYDRPGFGGSGSLPGHWDMKFQVEIVGMLLDQNPKLKHYVAGWSAGGPPTLAAAATYPDKISGIFIACGAVMPLGSIDGMLADIKCPITLAHGEEDDIVPFESMQYLVDRLKAAGKESLVLEARALPGVDHGVVRTKTKDVHDLLQMVVDKAEKP